MGKPYGQCPGLKLEEEGMCGSWYPVHLYKYFLECESAGILWAVRIFGGAVGENTTKIIRAHQEEHHKRPTTNDNRKAIKKSDVSKVPTSRRVNPEVMELGYRTRSKTQVLITDKTMREKRPTFVKEKKGTCFKRKAVVEM